MSTITQHTPSYPIRTVPMTRPFVWLARGWEDLMHHFQASFTYGAMVTFMGALILAYERHPLFIAAAMSCFMMVAPILAAGLTELSRCSDLNEEANFDSSLKALRRNHDNLLSFAGFLLVISVIWFAASYWLMAAIIGEVTPTIAQTVWGDVLHNMTGTQLTAYAISGGLLIGLVFALSVVTVPMIIDHHVDARSAMKTSLRVFVKDLPAIAMWGVIILALIAIAFASYLIGMLIIFPLLGHATWYAYQDLVKH